MASRAKTHLRVALVFLALAIIALVNIALGGGTSYVVFLMGFLAISHMHAIAYVDALERVHVHG